MRSYLNTTQIESIQAIAKDIRLWVTTHSHPDLYTSTLDINTIAEFVHTLDLLETVLGRLEIAAFLFLKLDRPQITPEYNNSLSWELWLLDVDEFFTSTMLEICNQVRYAWQYLDEIDKKFSLSFLKTPYTPLTDIILTRNKITHMRPGEFLSRDIASRYSILRRPYTVVDGGLKKQIAKETIPKVIKLLQDTPQEVLAYLTIFRKATIGDV